MKAQFVGSNEGIRPAASQRLTIRKALLACGIISSLLYIATTLLGALRWQGYSAISQSVSELMAIDSPSRPLVVPLFLTVGFLVIAFALGVWRSAGGKRLLRLVANLLLAYGVFDLVGPFVPIHLRGVQATLTDTLHIAVTGVLVLLTLLMIGFGAYAFGRWFRFYSLATILTLLVFGALAGMDGPRMAAGLPTPWLGLLERINIFGSLLWFMAFAIALIRFPPGGIEL